MQTLFTWLIIIIVATCFLLIYMIKMPGESYSNRLPTLSTSELLIQEHLEQHVTELAGEIGERNMWHYSGLQRAEIYISEILSQFGYEVEKQTYQLDGKSVSNIIVEIKGNTYPDKIIVIGAHYDSVKGSPGANDNASGVAALLELARQFNEYQSEHTIRFVFFVNEEPPFFKTKKMGSYHYAKRAKDKLEDIIAMVSIETIGYYSDRKNSQHYPFPFMFFYPSKGNFIGFVGNLPSRTLVKESITLFRQHAQFPSEGVAAPGWIPGVNWSDQWAFWKFGYPAVMITDTALFRYPHYHLSSDTPDKVDYKKMTLVITGLAEVIKMVE